MKYDIEKLIDILVIFARRNQELTKLRINKLLYFIDKCHLQKYGRFVLNDRYYRLPLGPIPSLTLNIINDFFLPRFKISGKKIGTGRLAEFFEPDKDSKGYDILKLKKEVNFGSLSESELDVINYVLDSYGKRATSTLVNISHRDRAWRSTTEPNEIDYDLFLDELPEEKKNLVRDLMKMDAENDLINAVLNK